MSYRKNCPPQPQPVQDILCINTEKVYDWIVNEANFDLNITNEDLPNGITCDDFDSEDVTCTVIPAEVDPIEVINVEDREFVIDGTEVELQIVTIRKNFVVIINFPTDNGNGDVELELEFSRSEQVVLCAPEGTEIDVTYAELDCFIVSFDCELGDTDEDDTFDALVSVRLCQSIQSVYPVTLEVEADYCLPREPLAVGPCPTPVRPEQCPVLFPVGSNRSQYRTDAGVYNYTAAPPEPEEPQLEVEQPEEVDDNQNEQSE
ncbi:hypothetical protein [Alkalibacillus haloalkaliphilus]|uniref:hypothetical protein n=1 Tax=Alkalibacillus haloalkaliphilus TaxID=94136 RepID=UPI00031F7650|nr:hypothetical protein [Alkalibacillus haloalkaliphilus]